MFCREEFKKTSNTRRKDGYDEKRIKIAKENTEGNIS